MYDRQPTRYLLPLHDFGAGSGSSYIRGPKGKAGRLVDYGVQNITEAFTQDATPAYVAVGNASDADAYGEELSMGAAAVADGGRSARTLYHMYESGYSAAVVDPTIPADTPVKLTYTAPTGGTPAGIAQPFVDIIWDL